MSMKRPDTVFEIETFLKIVQEFIEELNERRTRIRDFATKLTLEYSDDLYLTFKAEFVVIVVMLRALCLGCVDFKNGDKRKVRSASFDFEDDEGYSLRNALVLINGRQHWQDMVEYLNKEIEGGITILAAMKGFANSFVCHYDPKKIPFEESYERITKSNGFISPLESVILMVKSVFDAAKYHYTHIDMKSNG